MAIRVGTLGTMNFPPSNVLSYRRMIVNGFKFQLPEIFLYFPANIDIFSLHQYKMCGGCHLGYGGVAGAASGGALGGLRVAHRPSVGHPPSLAAAAPHLRSSQHHSTSVCSVLLCWSHVDTGWLELPLLHSASAVITTIPASSVIVLSS